VGWIIHDRIFAGVRAPILVFSLTSLAIAAAVAYPMARVFKRIPRRGSKVANVTTVATCLMAVLWGECFFDIYIALKSVGQIPTPHGILQIELIVMQEFGSFHWILKIISAVILCILCVTWGSPKLTLDEHVSAPNG
jgi:hypothetical protein